jgi:hypothetical protein
MNCRARAMSEIGHPQAGMNNNRHGRIVHFVALAIVIGGHGLLLLLLTKPRPMDAKTHSQSSGVLFLLELKPPPKPPSEEPRRVERPERISTSPVPRESASNQRIEPSTAIEAPPAVPEIDWQLEAQRSAEAMAPGWLEEQRRKCEEADGPPPPECRKRKYEFEWSEPTVGVAGLLPFVRVGKRCVIGLGFFACGLGKLPEPNGDLFKDMRDPDRPRSSVPDLPETVGR